MTAKKEGAGTVRSLVPVAVLVAICVVAGTLLGAVHALTEPIATANAQEKAQQTYAALLPAAASFDDVLSPELEDQEGVVAALAAYDEDNVLVGHVIVAEARGYGGQVPLAVAFDEGGSVCALSVMDNDETPGLGTKVASQDYVGQYVGLPAEPVSADDVDFISGATISSKAALAAFNRAVAAYGEVC